MDAAFEQLVDRETGPAAAPVSEAAVMRAVQDEVVRRAAGARRRCGPDPVQPTRGAMAEAPLPDAVAGPLAAFLAGIGDTDGQVPVPADLAAAMLAAPPPLPTPNGLPSRTAAARERALTALGRAAFLRGEVTSNNLETVEPLLRAATDSTELQPADMRNPALLQAAMLGAIDGLRIEASQVHVSRPAPADLWPPAYPQPAPSPIPAPEPAASPTRPAEQTSPARPAPLSPDTAITFAFEAFRKAKRVDGAWKASAERDAETTIRLFTEFLGDLSLREVTREVVREFRGHLLEICSD